MKTLITLLTLGLLTGTTFAAEPVDMVKRAEELKNLRWGMFVCWSFSTFSEKEWTPGVKDVSFFKATEVDTDQWARTAKEAGMGYTLTEFTYPILPPHKGGASWFYSLPTHDILVHPPQDLYQDYLGAVNVGNIFSINVGPDSNGKLRKIDVETPRKVGEIIKNPPPTPVSKGKPANASSDVPTIEEFQLFAPGAKLPATYSLNTADEPVVRAQLQPDGLTRLRVSSPAGKLTADYWVDLKNHHEPATSKTGAIQQWETWRYGGFFCFNDNQCVGLDYSTNKDPTIYKPTNLNVAGWVDTMKDAGMQYAVLTTRHTSGFLLWDSATSEFDVANSGDKTDVCAEFVKQCRRQEINPGFYYCLWGGPNSHFIKHPNAKQIILAQLYELATRYGPIPYFWIDMFNWAPTDLKPQEVYDLFKNINPDCVVIINQHIQDGQQIRYFPSDVLNGEVHLPPPSGHQHFRAVNGKRYYLPFEFEPVSQRISKKGTRTPWGNTGVWFTVRDSKSIPAADLFGWIKSAYNRSSSNVLLALSADHTGSMRPNDVKELMELRKLLDQEGLLNVPPLPVSQNKPAKASGVWEDNIVEYGPAAAFDDVSSTRWAGSVGSTNGWLEVDLEKDTKLAQALVKEPYPRTQEFVIEYKAGNDWKTAYRGTTIAGRQRYDFKPVTARQFRLNILKASDVPTIEEFQLFAPGAKLPASTAAKPEAIERWKDMRFGMFICWGPVTLTGQEIGWSRGSQTPIAEYDALYKKWNPENFDAKAWVKVAKDTGCKYIVFLTKHHDGFCLWDTKHTDYNIMNGPFKRDVTRELADACREAGIGFFPYYSTCDWHHPDFPLTSPGGKVKRETSNLDRYTEYLEAQTKELITNYGPLVGIWFDVPQAFDRARGERVIRHIRSLQPDILVNNRLSYPKMLGDFDTPEQNVGGFQTHRPWESCITLGTQWAWKPNDKLKSYVEAVRMLIVCATGDGNLALNTNPMPDGQIEPRQVESFRKIGEWLEKYGESIYGTRGGPFVAPDWKKRSFNTDRHHFSLPEGNWWGGSTHKGNVIYLHILRWPSDIITLPAIKQRIVKHTVLTGGEVTVKQTDAGISVTVPAGNRDAVDTIIKLELDAPYK